MELLAKDHKTTCVNTQGPYLNPRVVEGILDGQPFSKIWTSERKDSLIGNEKYSKSTHPLGGCFSGPDFGSVFAKPDSREAVWPVIQEKPSRDLQDSAKP